MRPRRRGLPAALAACAAAVLAVAGCTGVPSGSSPRTIDRIDVGQGSEPAQPGPTPGADPRTIVQRFLGANAVDPVHHDTARKYLAGSASARWSDATATIIDPRSVSNVENGVVTVTGRLVGSLGANGVYVPQLQGDGGGGGVESFQYRVAMVKGQNRIVGLAPGLVLTPDEFAQTYRQHALYFFDQSHCSLVPDSRWTALDGNQLRGWLVGQLASGPRPDLSSALTNDTLPAQANSRRVSATGDVPIKIEVPGSAQLDTAGKRWLAAQISATVTDPDATVPVQITDGRTPVPLPGGGTETTAREAAYPFLPTAPAPDVYYLRDGEVVDGTGDRVTGKLRDSPFFLNSVAVTRPAGPSGLTVAGITGTGAQSRLLLGTQQAGYRVTAVRGLLTRPAWAPTPTPTSTAPPEVWLGNGATLVRVVVNGNRATPSTVSINAGAGGGRIVALRLSPEGARIAMVIEAVNGSRRLFIGAVVRTAGQVRVDALPSISPDGVTIDDAGWIGPQKLIAIGRTVNAGDAAIFETNVDGSFWTARPLGSTLPGPPDSVTVAVGQYAWVSTNGTVWRQAGRGWTSPGGTQQTTGYKPAYVE